MPTPTLSYTTIDKTKWGDGPWKDEPDKVQWIDEETGLDCLMVRTENGGHWCGYVGLPPGHKFHGVNYSDVAVHVHGGLTFADHCREDEDETKGICHIPAPGRPAKVWWLGFDCAHCYDLSPAIDSRLNHHSRDSCYRDQQYVKSEVESLAKQLFEENANANAHIDL